jgi:hypothetical protein
MNSFFLRVLFAIWILIFLVIGYFVSILIWNQSSNVILAVLLIGIAAILSGAYLFVMFSMSGMLRSGFDDIKNKVALKEYSDIQEFQNDVLSFLINFFRFPGASIVGGKFEISGKATVNKGKEVSSELELPDNQTKLTYLGVHEHLAVFYVPISLNGQTLGVLTLFLAKPVFPFVKRVLSEFEEYYLDDQLMIVLRDYNN